MGMLIREFFDKICDMFKKIVDFFKKHSKKDEDLKYDFLPSAIEIIEKPELGKKPSWLEESSIIPTKTRTGYDILNHTFLPEINQNVTMFLNTEVLEFLRFLSVQKLQVKISPV